MDWTDIVVSQSIAAFLTFLKTLKGKKKETAKKQVLKVFQSIKAVYGDDEDFQ